VKNWHGVAKRAKSQALPRPLVCCARVNAHLNDHVTHVCTHARIVAVYMRARARAADGRVCGVATNLREVAFCVPIDEEAQEKKKKKTIGNDMKQHF